MRNDTPHVAIAGAGIAGLTAALSFARKGWTASVYERAELLEEIGAGIQLSPNATRILGRLGVLEHLREQAVRPDSVVLLQASTLAEVARVPLGVAAEHRWGAPYLTAHRADLQAALLAEVDHHDAISIHFGHAAKDFSVGPAALVVERDKTQVDADADLVVAADGVWSAIRALGGTKGQSRFVGQLAWRRTIQRAEAEAIDPQLGLSVVSAFLHPDFHLIAYPVRGGDEVNLAAFTPFRKEIDASWKVTPDIAVLRQAMQGTAPALRKLVSEGDGWTAWPIHVADLDGAWIDPGGMAMIGDAAHAMTPFAAQGAAMAIEDAWTLAEAISRPGPVSSSLTAWNIDRRKRVLRVARRGALNEFAWHAKGPVAAARNMVLRMRGPQRLAADLDWLYGYEA